MNVGKQQQRDLYGQYTGTRKSEQYLRENIACGNNE
jgi:hypothetical protein